MLYAPTTERRRAQRGANEVSKSAVARLYIKNNKLIIAVMKFAINEINNAFEYFVFNNNIINMLSANITAVSMKKKLLMIFW